MIPSTHEEAMTMVTTMPTARAAVTDFGGYNDMPTPAKAITADEFSVWLTNEPIVAVEYRQPAVLKFASTRIFWLQCGNGLAVSREYVRDGERAWQARWWLLGCDHEWECIHVDGFVHTYRCVRCGRTKREDSSG